jgi:hypothetical protein
MYKASIAYEISGAIEKAKKKPETPVIGTKKDVHFGHSLSLTLCSHSPLEGSECSDYF